MSVNIKLGGIVLLTQLHSSSVRKSNQTVALPLYFWKTTIIRHRHLNPHFHCFSASRWHCLAAVWHIRFPSGPDVPHSRGERHGGRHGCFWRGEEGSTGKESKRVVLVSIDCLFGLRLYGSIRKTVFCVISHVDTFSSYVSVLQYCYSMWGLFL